MLPLRRVTIARFSEDSGWVFRIGSAISRMGLIRATESATPESEAKAAATEP